MGDLLSTVLPMILAMALSQFIYLKIDKKYEITHKVNLKLKVDQQWKPFFCIFSSVAIIFLIGMLGGFINKIFKVRIPNTAFYVFNGIIIGIIVPMCNKIEGRKTI